MANFTLRLTDEQEEELMKISGRSKIDKIVTAIYHYNNSKKELRSLKTENELLYSRLQEIKQACKNKFQADNQFIKVSKSLT